MKKKTSVLYFFWGGHFCGTPPSQLLFLPQKPRPAHDPEIRHVAVPTFPCPAQPTYEHEGNKHTRKPTKKNNVYHLGPTGDKFRGKFGVRILPTHIEGFCPALCPGPSSVHDPSRVLSPNTSTGEHESTAPQVMHACQVIDQNPACM